MQNQTDGFVIFICMFSQVYSVVKYIPEKLISLIIWAFPNLAWNPIRPPGYPDWYTKIPSEFPNRICIKPRQEIIDYCKQEAGDFNYAIYFNNEVFTRAWYLSKYALNVELNDYDLRLISKFVMNCFLYEYYEVGFEDTLVSLMKNWGLLFKGFVLPYCLRFHASQDAIKPIEEFINFTYDKLSFLVQCPQLRASYEKYEHKILYYSSKYDYRNRNFALENIPKNGLLVDRASAINFDPNLSFEDIAKHAVYNWDN